MTKQSYDPLSPFGNRKSSNPSGMLAGSSRSPWLERKNMWEHPWDWRQHVLEDEMLEMKANITSITIKDPFTVAVVNVRLVFQILGPGNEQQGNRGE